MQDSEDEEWWYRVNVFEENGMDETEMNEIFEQMKSGESPGMESAFRLLRQLQEAAVDQRLEIPIRSTASPYVPSLGNVYVVNTKHRQLAPCRDKEQISVTFQSVLNGEPWWSPNKPQYGVCSRPMGRVARSKNKSENKEVHGYRGRMFTLVTRNIQESPYAHLHTTDHTDTKKEFSSDAIEDALMHEYIHGTSSYGNSLETSFGMTGLGADTMLGVVTKDDEVPTDSMTRTKRTRTTPENKKYNVIGNIHLVQVWRDDSNKSNEAKRRRISTHSKAPTDSEPNSPISPNSITFDEKETIISGDLLVKGNLKCDGQVFGTFVTPPAAADYSEWFKWHQDIPYKPPKGSVVQLRSPEQALCLDTSGSGPIMVISSTPSVAAGVPDNQEIAKNAGALVAFVGQVPIRCRGSIQCGDELVPSGFNDGTAVSAHVHRRRLLKPGTCPTCDTENFPVVGVAMQSVYETKNSHVNLVLCLVRWEHAIERQLHCVVDRELILSQTVLTQYLLNLCICSALTYFFLAMTWLFNPFALYRNEIDIIVSVLVNAVAFFSMALLFCLLIVLRGIAFPCLFSLASLFIAAFTLAVTQIVSQKLHFMNTETFFSSAWLTLGLIYHALILKVAIPLQNDRNLSNLLRHAIYGSVGSTSTRRQTTLRRNSV